MRIGSVPELPCIMASPGIIATAKGQFIDCIGWIRLFRVTVGISRVPVVVPAVQNLAQEKIGVLFQLFYRFREGIELGECLY